MLCRTLGGLKLPILTVTNSVFEEQLSLKNEKPFRDKKLIYIIARIHPG
jgi:hypothetical protein